MTTKQEAARIKKRNSARLLKLPGVVGVGVEEDEQGRCSLVIHVEEDRPEVLEGLPDNVEDCPVKVVRTGRYRKF